MTGTATKIICHEQKRPGDAQTPRAATQEDVTPMPGKRTSALPDLRHLPLMGREQAAGYLGGIIDGEGCMKWVNGKNIQTRSLVLTITNTDWDILDATMDCCDVLDLRYRIEEVAKKNVENRAWARTWCVTISGRTSFQTIADEVPIRSAKKRSRLEERLATYQRYRRVKDARAHARTEAARFRAEL